jgi:hypothetical protein
MKPDWIEGFDASSPSGSGAGQSSDVLRRSLARASKRAGKQKTRPKPRLV